MDTTVSPEIRLVALILLGAIFTLGLGIAIGRWMIQRHESRALIDARAQLGRRRAADVRNEREVAVLTQARLVDATDLDSLHARLEDAEALSVRVGQVEQQSMIIERLYRQVAELRGQLAKRAAAGNGASAGADVPAQAAPPAAETGKTSDTAAEQADGDAELSGVPNAQDGVDVEAAPVESADYPLVDEKALADSVDIAAFEAANRIVNGVPRARAGASRRKAAAADRDDLTLIEGVGPRIQSLCHAAGITTWQKMADTPVERLREILDAAGSRYTGHQPQSWPEQAAALAGTGERGHTMAGEARAG